MKTIRKAIAIVLSLCLMAGMFAGLSLSASATTTRLYTYELFDDYFALRKDTDAAGASFTGTSPWSLQYKQAGGDWVTGGYKIWAGQAYADNSWNYLQSELYNDYQPGFSYYSGTSTANYGAVKAYPAYRSDFENYKYDVAYAFTAPYSGTYEVHGSDDTKDVSWEMTNWIWSDGRNIGVDFGVRITVDGTAVWPTSDNSRYYNDADTGAWAKFSSDEGAQDFDVPTVSGIKAEKNSVIRIEYTMFTAHNVNHQCGIYGMMDISLTEMAVPEVAEPTEATTYELYDYLDKVAEAHDNNTIVDNNDTPWSLQLNQQGTGWVETLDTTSRAVDGDDWIYYTDAYLPTGDNAWGGYAPGFTFYHPADTSGRYYYNVAIPSRSAWASTDRWSDAGPYSVDVAYAFTAPTDGMYKVDKANQDKVLTFDDSNSFARYMTGDMTAERSLDYGVRITVDGETVWPAYDYEYAENGWAVFGYRDAKTTSIPVPTVEDIAMTKGQVLRVEFTVVTPAYEPDVCRIKGSFSVSYVEPLKEEIQVPAEYTFYDIYDYYANLATGTDNYTPWSIETSLITAENSAGATWKEATVLSDWDGNYLYLHDDTTDWGGNWPGVKFHWYQPDVDAGNRYQYGYITALALQGSNIYGWNSAYTFEAPYNGNFTFSKGNQDKVVSFDDMNYFQYQNKSSGMNSGVRITVNGNTVWPTSSNENYYEGYARFGNGIDGVAEKIEIPTLDMYLEKNDVVRVEFKQFSNGTAEWPWDQQIMGLVSMSYDPASSEIAVANIRDYEDLGLYMDEVGAINSTVEMYAGEEAYSTVATTVNDGMSLSVYAPNQGVKIAFNGFEVVMNGAESTLTAPGKDAESISVADAADDIYEITVRISPVLTSAEVTGTYFDLTVNGISVLKIYTDIIPAGVKERGIVISNISSDSIELRAGGISLVSGSTFIVDIDNKVLYVGETTDLDVVKANIESAGRYIFTADVATNAVFNRENGSEYTFAVKGDLTGDGINDIKDLIRMKRAIAGAVELSSAQVMAASFGDTSKSQSDCLKDIVKYILFK